MGAIDANQAPGTGTPGSGNAAYVAWNGTRLCCIYSDGVTCGPGTNNLTGCPKGPQAPAPDTVPRLIGAHVYDSNVHADTAEECLIIPTCDFHNNSAGNDNRNQNWGQGSPQKVKAGTPYVVRKIKTAVVTAKGNKGVGKGQPALTLGPWTPATPGTTVAFPGP